MNESGTPITKITFEFDTTGINELQSHANDVYFDGKIDFTFPQVLQPNQEITLTKIDTFLINGNAIPNENIDIPLWLKIDDEKIGRERLRLLISGSDRTSPFMFRDFISTQETDEDIKITIQVFDGSSIVTSNAIIKRISMDYSEKILEVLTLNDDGIAGDEYPNDGFYTGIFSSDECNYKINFNFIDEFSNSTYYIDKLIISKKQPDNNADVIIINPDTSGSSLYSNIYYQNALLENGYITDIWDYYYQGIPGDYEFFKIKFLYIISPYLILHSLILHFSETIWKIMENWQSLDME